MPQPPRPTANPVPKMATCFVCRQRGVQDDMVYNKRKLAFRHVDCTPPERRAAA